MSFIGRISPVAKEHYRPTSDIQKLFHRANLSRSKAPSNTVAIRWYYAQGLKSKDFFFL
jgi:hypothetical protein